MRRIIFSIILAVLSVAWLSPMPVRAENRVTVEFFWGIGCPHCAKVEPYITQWEKKYPDVTFKRYEVYKDRGNAELLLQRYSTFNVSEDKRGIPAVFVGQEYFIGDQPVIDNLEAAIQRAVAAGPINANTNTPTPATDTSNSKLTIWTILGAAFVDSINPCAIAVLLVLFSGLMMSPKPGRMFRAALAFIGSIYLTYFLFGMGIVYTIHIAGVSAWMTKIVGTVAILVGLANLKDFFWYGGGGFVMEIPRRWRPTMVNLIDRVTSPLGAFIAGFAVTLFELPCTGGPYFFVLGLLAKHTSWASIIPILLFYNLIFVSPLIVLAILITKGFASTKGVGDWKDRNLRQLHLIAGLIMIALGVWVLF